MSDTTGKVENAIWPMPKFYFKVAWGSDTTIAFSEVSGLDVEAQIIEYRHGDSENFWNIKMPGLKKVGNVTMKRGVFVGDNKYYDWFKQIKLNTVSGGRITVTVSLLNEKNEATMVWTLNNAWPTKITSTDLKSDGNEAAIDTIEIAYESIDIVNNNKP